MLEPHSTVYTRTFYYIDTDEKKYYVVKKRKRIYASRNRKRIGHNTRAALKETQLLSYNKTTNYF